MLYGIHRDVCSPWGKLTRGGEEERQEDRKESTYANMGAGAGFRRNDNYSGWHYVVINLEAD